MGKRVRRQFTAEFKREAVRLAQRPDVSPFRVAKELGLDHSVLRRWMQQFASGTWDETAGAALKSKRTEEVEHLRRELERVKSERDVLKKALAYFAKEHS
jgi:transposase